MNSVSVVKFLIRINAFTLSSESIFKKFWIALPFAFLAPSGISNTFFQKHRPLAVKNKIVACIDAG